MRTSFRYFVLLLLALFICPDLALAQRRGGGGMRGGGGGMRGGAMRGGGGVRGGGFGGGRSISTRGGARTSVSSRPRPATRPVTSPRVRSAAGSGNGSRIGGQAGARPSQPIADRARPSQPIAGTRPGGDRGSIRNSNISRDNVLNNNNINYNPEWDVNGDWGDHWGDGCCHHPLAAAAVVGTAAAVGAAAATPYPYGYYDYPYYDPGTVVYSLPPECTTLVIGEISYEQCGDTWYQPSFYGTEVSYIVVSPPA